MLTDSIKLISGAVLENLQIENGAAFPTENLFEERFFYLDTDITGYTRGLYVYRNGAWETSNKIPESSIQNGTTFPSEPISGQLFYLDTASGQNPKGLYYYLANVGWQYSATGNVTMGTSFPASPYNGQIFYLTATSGDYLKGLYTYNAQASEWQYSTLTGVLSGNSFPSSPYDGQMFYLNVNSGQNIAGLYRYSSSQSTWKYATSGNVSTATSFPSSPYDGQLFYLNTASGNYRTGLYRYNVNTLSWDYATSDAYVYENVAHKNVAGGYAGLDENSLLSPDVLPKLAITDSFVVASQNAMLALTAQTGDVAIRTDLRKSFILSDSNPAVLGNWKELLSPTDVVTSVNGQTGAVQLNFEVLTGTSFPSSPYAGQMFYLSATNGTTLKGLYRYNSSTSNWDYAALCNSQSGTTLPAVPYDGQMFFVTQAYDKYKVGLYYYTAYNTTWNQVYQDISAPFDLSGYVPGLPMPGTKMMLFTSARPYRIPADFSGSISRSVIPPTLDVTYTIKKNTVTVGTLFFASGSNTGVFSQQAAIDMAAGDILAVVAPSTIDGTHGEIMWTIVASLI